MKKIAQDYRDFFNDKASIFSLLFSSLFFLLSLIVNYFASRFAFIKKDNPVADLLLDILPVVNMGQAFRWSTIIFLIFVVVFLAVQPKKVPFVLNSLALFVITRSIFISLTHIGPSPLNTLSTPSDIGRAFTSGADLFFSGHTGAPFLFALLFWYNIKIRIIFIMMSVMAAVGVLLGHIHYSIDVGSAYFITYGVYVMACKLFKQDNHRFNIDAQSNARISI